MERRFRVRLDELLGDAVVAPELARGMLPRWQRFLKPFLASLATPAQPAHAHHSGAGLLSDLKHQTAAGIAYLHDQECQGLQKFLGQALWDERPFVIELVRQVGTELGAQDGVLVFAPAAFPKQGTASVGVQRQWCGRLGKVENCQVGVFRGSASRQDHALVDCRLFLPQAWAKNKDRRLQAGVPQRVRFHTRHELALAWLDEHGATWPHAWVTGADELGRSSWFRQELRRRGEHYLRAVPSHTAVRDLLAPAAPYPGQGRPRTVPFPRGDRWAAAQAAPAWQTLDVRDGAKGPLLVPGRRTLVQARTEGRVAQEAAWLVVFREQQSDGTWKHDSLLAQAPLTTPLPEFARVFKAAHRIEESRRRAKSEGGLGDYQVRTWLGWHHHQALSLVATWFLTQEARRGKKIHASSAGPPGALVSGAAAAAGVGL